MLTAWPSSAPPPEATFLAPLTHLAAQGPSPAQLQRIADAWCIPVANATALVEASRVVGRLPRRDLAPFVYELPAALVSVSDLLLSMGMRAELSAGDVVSVLARVAAQQGQQPLSTRQLLASVHSLYLLIIDLGLTGTFQILCVATHALLLPAVALCVFSAFAVLLDVEAHVSHAACACNRRDQHTLQVAMLESVVDGSPPDARGMVCRAVVPCLDSVLRPAQQCLCAAGAPARLLHRCGRVSWGVKRRE